MAYPHKWSPISYKSSAGQRQRISQRPMLYRWTTQPSATCQAPTHLVPAFHRPLATLHDVSAELGGRLDRFKLLSSLESLEDLPLFTDQWPSPGPPAALTSRAHSRRRLDNQSTTTTNHSHHPHSTLINTVYTQTNGAVFLMHPACRHFTSMNGQHWQHSVVSSYRHMRSITAR